MWKGIVIAVGVIAVLAACGGPAPGGGSTAASAGVWRDFARCVRANGVPGFPDPQFDDHGNPTFQGTNVKDLPASVQTACGAVLARLPAQTRSGPAEDVAALERFAQCMRAHGITDWPDPDAQGRFDYPQTLVQAHAQHSAYWVRARAAWDGPCQRYDNGHIGDPQT